MYSPDNNIGCACHEEFGQVGDQLLKLFEGQKMKKIFSGSVFGDSLWDVLKKGSYMVKTYMKPIHIHAHVHRYAHIILYVYIYIYMHV